MQLGIPGIGFRTEKRRFYPGGATASHIVGLTNIDNQGIAGMEKYIDEQGLTDLQASGLAVAKDLQPVQAVDRSARPAHRARRDRRRRWSAITPSPPAPSCSTSRPAKWWRWPRCRTSIPTIRYNAQDKDRLNRMSAGLYEMGSTFKSFTTAMALDSGKVDAGTAGSTRRVRSRIGHSDHPRFPRQGPRADACRKCSSTPPTSARRGRPTLVGIEGHREFLHRLGLLDRMQTELPEVATPDRAEGLEEGQLDHHRLRPWRVDDAAADGGRLRGADERRLPDRSRHSCRARRKRR